MIFCGRRSRDYFTSVVRIESEFYVCIYELLLFTNFTNVYKMKSKYRQLNMRHIANEAIAGRNVAHIIFEFPMV